MKICVVDDEDLLVKGIRFNLKNEGYEVVTGSNGLEAVDLARNEKPDLMVLDVMMPEMDGLTACTKIREFSRVPIILLTAKTDDMDKLMGFDVGADDYLTKPFNILELKARIRALLRRSGSAQEQADNANRLTIGDISLDLDSRNAYAGGKLAESLNSSCATPTGSIPGKPCWTPSGPWNTAATSAPWTCISAGSGKSWKRTRRSRSIF